MIGDEKVPRTETKIHGMCSARLRADGIFVRGKRTFPLRTDDMLMPRNAKTKIDCLLSV